MENKMLALKVYDVDYSFIIKNYLDEKLWEKEWTIFVYKRFKVMLRLDSINVKTKAIWFEVFIDDNSEENTSWTSRVSDTFKYTISIDDINILKKLLNSTIFGLIKKLEEEAYIENTDKYNQLDEMKREERERLQQIAEEFLESEGVRNEEIKEAYIDYYIDKNEKVYDLKNDYITEMRYRILTDFYVAFLDAVNDKEKLEIIKFKVGEEELEEILNRIEEYKDYMDTKDFESDMKENLEEI